jgi:MFS family permease
MKESGTVARRRIAAGTGAAAVLLASLDAYVVVTITVDIMRDLSIPIDRLERVMPVVTGYLLGYVAAMPMLGQLSDRLGRAPVIRGCLLGFAAGSLVSAAAPSLPVLVGGRVLQGAAGGALLPVTFAVIGDHWEARSRTVPLGAVGASQELGSVLGPLYGAGLAALIGWRGIFWINVPLALGAAVAVERALPRSGASPGVQVDLGGGLIMTVSLMALVAGLYNPDPSAGVLAPWGPYLLGLCIAGLAAFFIWERQSASRLIDPRGMQMRPFAAALGCSFLSGVALMATLVDIPLLAQTLLGSDTLGGALILSRFLVALGLGALVGGISSRRAGERTVAVAGLALAGASFWLISRWPEGMLAARHRVGPLAIPRVDADLFLAGLGLGLVIAPLTSVALASSPAHQHGVVSASVVVARMAGMLAGIAALTAAGLHRFHQLTSDLNPPLPFGGDPDAYSRQLAAYQRGLRAALHTEYQEIFAITAGVCLVASLMALALSSSRPRSPAGASCCRVGRAGLWTLRKSEP